MTDYKIHKSNNITDIENMVKQALAQGWGLHGNLVITSMYDYNTQSYIYTYFQAVIKP